MPGDGPQADYLGVDMPDTTAPEQAADTLRSEVRAAISNAYYDARNAGRTMEHAADDAAARVMARLSRPAEKVRPGFTVSCLAHPDSSLHAETWDAIEEWCDTHAETVPHDERWAITFPTSVGVTYRGPVLIGAGA